MKNYIIGIALALALAMGVAAAGHAPGDSMITVGWLTRRARVPPAPLLRGHVLPRLDHAKEQAHPQESGVCEWCRQP